MFAQAMYADTHEKLAEAIQQVDDLEDQDKFRERIHGNLERQTEWVKLYRVNVVTRNNNTNNYAKASIRIMKDNFESHKSVQRRRSSGVL